MRVHFTIVGQADWPDNVVVDLDVIPREGEIVYLRELDRELHVRTVVHNPQGGELESGPYVYIVLGDRRPT